MKRKIFCILFALVLVLSFGLATTVPAGAADGTTLEVSQPIQVTNDSHYERGQSIVYDGTNYWLFYGRSVSCTGWYQSGDPDVYDYALYYKKASTVAGLASATASAVTCDTVSPTGTFMGETGAVYYGGKVWVFASIPSPTYSDRNAVYGWHSTDGSSWTSVGPFWDNKLSGSLHHDEVVFGDELWIVEGAADGDFRTRHGDPHDPTTPAWDNSQLDVGEGSGGLVHFFVDGGQLYLGALRTGTPRANVIYKYDASWVKVNECSSTGWDPTLFKVNSTYVFAQSPWVDEGGGRQYTIAWSSTTLDNIFVSASKMVTAGRYGTNTWTDMWPIGFTDQTNDSYLFYTSERDPAHPEQEMTGNIWYLPVDWTVTNDHYTYIQEAIDAATSGDTITVAAGTYTATSLASIVITKDNLSLIGESRDETIIDAGTWGTSSTGWPKGIHIYANNVTIENFTVQGFQGDGENTGGYGVLFRDYAHDDETDGETYIYYTSCTLRNVTVTNCYSSIYALVHRHLTVQNCTVTDSLSDGMFIARYSSDATVTGCHVTNSGDHGIWVGKCWKGLGSAGNAIITDNELNGAREGGITFYASDTATITGNTITNVAGETSPDGYSAGALSLIGDCSNVTATNNIIYNNRGTWGGHSGTGNGIGIWEGTPANIVLHNNDIYGNTGYGCYNYTGVSIDAKDNWWGDATGPGGVGPGSGNAVSANVDYSPWEGAATGTSPMTWYTNDSIQDAVDAASPGDTINVADGTYTITEAITVDKGLTITGNTDSPSSVLVTYSEASQALDCFDMQANDITVQGIKVVNGRYGFNFATSDPTGCTISDCAIDSCYEGAINIEGGSGHTISGNTITHCLTSGTKRGAIHIYGCPDTTIDGNTLTGNGLTGAHATMGIYVKFTYPSSSSERVEIINNNISGMLGQNADIQAYNAPYTYIYNNTISNSEDKGIAIFGIDGDPAYTGTSNRVEVIGNTISSTYYPGLQAANAPYTYFYNNTLTQCNYYGGDGTGDFDYASIHIDAGSANCLIDSNTVSDGINGIQLWSDSCTVTNNTIYDMGLTYADTKTTTDGTYYNSAILYGDMYDVNMPTSATISGNNIHDNYWGLFVISAYTGTVTATNNWWGHATGPTHTSNPDGSGDAVSDNVVYSPWLGATKDTTPMTFIVDDVGPQPAAGYIQAAIDAALSGDTINVAAGTYKEHITIDKSDLSLIGEDRETTIIDATQDSSWAVAKAGILIGEYPLTDGVHGVTISGFTIRDAAIDETGGDFGGEKYGPGPGGLCGIQIYNSSNNTIEDNILSNNYWQIWLVAEWPAAGYTECMNNRIANNIIQNSENDGVYLYSDGGVFIQDTEIANNEISNAYGEYASGIEFWGWPDSGPTPTISSTVISSNNITSCTYGVRIRDDVSDITGTSVNYNNFVDNTNYGIYNGVTSTIDATNNWWGDATGPGGVGPGSGNAVSANVDFHPWWEALGGTSTPPTVDSTVPSPDGTSVDVDANITAIFSEAMKADTISNTTFTLANGGSVAGEVTYDADTKMATFNPTGNLAYGTTYTATITTGAQDVAGNGLAADYPWSFTTLTTPSAVTTSDASDITTTSATLNGNLSSLGTASSVDVSFEWGETTAYGNETAPETMAAPGAFSASLTDLVSGTTYHFRAVAVGDGTSYGDDLTVEVITYQVTDLDTGNPTQNSIDLTWTTPEAGASAFSYFDARYSTATITPDNWGGAARATGEPAPVAGASQGIKVKGLDGETTYYFAVKLVDEEGLVGLLSNIASVATLAAPPIDETYPGQITGLAASAGSPATTRIVLSWTATGDDGNTGTATSYEIRRSASAITGDNWALATIIYNNIVPRFAGGSESFVVSRLTPGTTYCFAIQAKDEAGNTSPTSNSPSILTAANLPTVTGISPASGDNSQARTLTIDGTNFVDGTNVARLVSGDNTFDLSSVTYVSSTKLTAGVATGAPTGTYKVRVINVNGTSELSSATYEVTQAEIPLPVVTNLIPQMAASGSTVSGVQIFGENLTGATVVSFDGTAASNVTVISDTKITADVPGLVAGEYDVRVTTPAGTNGISGVKFVVSDPVTITEGTTGDTTTSGVVTLNTPVIPVQLTLTTDTSETATQATDTDAEIEVVIPPGTAVTDSEGNPYTGNLNPPRVVKPDESVLTGLPEDAVVIEMGNPEETINFDQDFVATVTITASTEPDIYYYNKDTKAYELAGKTGTKDGVDYVPGGTKLGQENSTYTMGLLLDHMSVYIASVESLIPPAAGGGGGGAPPAPPAPPAGTTDVRGMVSDVGAFLESVAAISEDGLFTLTIPAGTVGLTKDLEPLTEVNMVIMDDPPAPPEGANVIGLVYDLGPDGAIFDPPITLTFSYDPADILEGVAEEDLVLAYYDEAAGEWLELEGCVVDPETNCVTACVCHFTAFRAMFFIPAPAAFSLSTLEVSPAEVETGGTVTISALVENTGEKMGISRVTLKVNGKAEQVEHVALDAGASTRVSFTTSRDAAGSYAVDVNRLSGSFTVKEKPAPVPAPPTPAPPAVNWPLISGIIAGVVVVGLLIFFLVRRRAH